MEIILHGISVFMLIFCRMTAFFVVAPVFSSRGVPNTFKIGLSAMIALLILMIQGTNQVIPQDLGYVLMIIREVLIGLLMGFVAYLIFSVILTAGSFIDIQIGFGMANVLDPMTGASAPVLGNFKYIIATLVFLSINGHHYLLDAVIRSYNWIPLSNDVFQRIYRGGVTEFLVSTFSQSFTLAFQMAAPLVVALFLTDVALGFLARTAPQFNVFVIGIPLKIIVGLVVLLLLIPGFIYAFEHLFEVMFNALHNLFGTLGSRPT
ncbi:MULTISPECIES: flagellar biosynthetic protein FliR [Paenibacillus]|uniref:Flagellar biosynthetic protein FliR n=1 Tax=Paenibacillus vini TaxID=1476024 RepID=A0ABQ4M8F0_9BACL|nr:MULTISPECIES: flagellar biosynthetic protein FliR [Paenibacillus]MBQ4898953.1 flagellar type III secretion system protein FliR [Paenibacillus sp. Marseille-P2973]MDN4066854.1 flagellar biosynthetic protein FliR [Paenibacillus vini]GIP52250.1 flagellar biosynthetic protein FliR [Paenibacillus vini]